MKKIVLGIAATAMVAGLVPFALIAKSRATPKDALPPHLVMDMDKQPRGKAQRATPMFADQRFMRPHIEGTVAREDMWLKSPTLNDLMGTHPVGLAGGQTAILMDDSGTHAAVTQGRIRTPAMTDEAYAALKPPSRNDAEVNGDTTFYVRKVPAAFDVSVAFLMRGQERFAIYCAPCHGESGYGDGPIAQRAASLTIKNPVAISGWVAPQNLHEAKIVARPDGHLFNTITHGIRNMPAYESQIGIEDRWAIVAYLRALQRSQKAQPGDPGAR